MPTGLLINFIWEFLSYFNSQYPEDFFWIFWFLRLCQEHPLTDAPGSDQDFISILFEILFQCFPVFFSFADFLCTRRFLCLFWLFQNLIVKVDIQVLWFFHYRKPLLVSFSSLSLDYITSWSKCYVKLIKYFLLYILYGLSGVLINEQKF